MKKEGQAKIQEGPVHGTGPVNPATGIYLNGVRTAPNPVASPDPTKTAPERCKRFKVIERGLS